MTSPPRKCLDRQQNASTYPDSVGACKRTVCCIHAADYRHAYALSVNQQDHSLIQLHDQFSFRGCAPFVGPRCILLGTSLSVESKNMCKMSWFQIKPPVCLQRGQNTFHLLGRRFVTARFAEIELYAHSVSLVKIEAAGTLCLRFLEVRQRANRLSVTSSAVCSIVNVDKPRCC